MFSMEIADKIREIAKDKNLSKMDIHRRSGLSYRQVFNILQGKGNPRLASLHRIAHALGVDISEITEKKKLIVKEETAQYISTTKPDAIKTTPPKNTISETIDLLSEQLGVDRQSIVEMISKLLNNKEV